MIKVEHTITTLAQGAAGRYQVICCHQPQLAEIAAWAVRTFSGAGPLMFLRATMRREFSMTWERHLIILPALT
jgi:hypothetical protein